MNSTPASRYGLPHVVGWIAAYLAVCGIVPVLLGFFMETAGFPARLISLVDFIAQVLLNTAYFSVLMKLTGLRVCLSYGLTAGNLLLAVGCALFFFIACDLLLDPLFAKMLPSSETEYQQAMAQLRLMPVISGLQICLVAPVVEELLMRGIILPVLSGRYGWPAGLAVSTLLFAFLHFNFLQNTFRSPLRTRSRDSHAENKVAPLLHSGARSL